MRKFEGGGVRWVEGGGLKGSGRVETKTFFLPKAKMSMFSRNFVSQKLSFALKFLKIFCFAKFIAKIYCFRKSLHENFCCRKSFCHQIFVFA
jgi:hypothetical protein